MCSEGLLCGGRGNEHLTGDRMGGVLVEPKMLMNTEEYDVSSLGTWV